MIYLASPYSHEEDRVMEDRYQKTMAFVARNLKQGPLIFSPIVYAHPMAVYHDLPKEWQFWEYFDIGFIRQCSEFWVLQLDGWEESEGVQNEIRHANWQKIPLSYKKAED